MTANDSWWLLMTTDGNWWLLTTDNWWQLMTTDDYWRLLMTTDDFWRPLATINNYWWLLTSTDVYWQPLAATDYYWLIAKLVLTVKAISGIHTSSTSIPESTIVKSTARAVLIMWSALHNCIAQCFFSIHKIRCKWKKFLIWCTYIHKKERSWQCIDIHSHY